MKYDYLGYNLSFSRNWVSYTFQTQTLQSISFENYRHFDRARSQKYDIGKNADHKKKMKIHLDKK